MQPSQRATLHVDVGPELSARLRAAAAAGGRTPSEWTRELLQRELARAHVVGNDRPDPPGLVAAEAQGGQAARGHLGPRRLGCRRSAGHQPRDAVPGASALARFVLVTLALFFFNDTATTEIYTRIP